MPLPRRSWIINLPSGSWKTASSQFGPRLPGGAVRVVIGVSVLVRSDISLQPYGKGGE